MQPPMQHSAPPIAPKRRRGVWTLVIGGAAGLFVILLVGIAVALFLSGSDSVWKGEYGG